MNEPTFKNGDLVRIGNKVLALYQTKDRDKSGFLIYQTVEQPPAGTDSVCGYITQQEAENGQLDSAVL